MDRTVVRETVEGLVLRVGQQRAQYLVWREIALAALDLAAEQYALVVRQRETIASLREAHRKRPEEAAA
jgi:hypothetical protein